jgi:hypothetical protein
MESKNMLNHSPGTILFPLFILGILWMSIVSALFNRLKKKHLQEYESLGRPTVSRYGINGAALGFVLRRGHRELGDTYLSCLSDGALLVFVAEILVAILIFPSLMH